ncbi:MAG: hypothetical protein ACREOE_09080, partial [Gemmatimonadales bacterium]
MTRRRIRMGVLAAVASCMTTWGAIGAAPASAAGACLNGTGSSFAGPEVSQWIVDGGKAPYNLCMNYSSQSSGDGRFQFANQTVDYGVTDIEYQPYP